MRLLCGFGFGRGLVVGAGQALERLITARSMHAPIAAAMIVGRIQPSWFAWSGLHMRTELMCSVKTPTCASVVAADHAAAIHVPRRNYHSAGVARRSGWVAIVRKTMVIAMGYRKVMIGTAMASTELSPAEASTKEMIVKTIIHAR